MDRETEHALTFGICLNDYATSERKSASHEHVLDRTGVESYNPKKFTMQMLHEMELTN